jgi:hypothetical protein
MHVLSLNKLWDFIHVTYSMRKYYTKVEYFSKLILFIAIYLPLDQKLIHNKKFYAGNNYDQFCTSY